MVMGEALTNEMPVTSSVVSPGTWTDCLRSMTVSAVPNLAESIGAPPLNTTRPLNSSEPSPKKPA